MLTIKQLAYRQAREFKVGRGRAWPWLANKDMIVDAEVMDHVRAAQHEGRTIDSDWLLEFRSALVEALAKQGYGL
jgi:hypothetical protein